MSQSVGLTQSLLKLWAVFPLTLQSLNKHKDIQFGLFFNHFFTFLTEKKGSDWHRIRDNREIGTATIDQKAK